jgi:hypothetical protein
MKLYFLSKENVPSSLSKTYITILQRFEYMAARSFINYIFDNKFFKHEVCQLNNNSNEHIFNIHVYKQEEVEQILETLILLKGVAQFHPRAFKEIEKSIQILLNEQG